MTPLRQRMIEDMQVRNLSAVTQRVYVDQVALYARHFGKSPAVLGPEEIRQYQLYLTKEKKLSASSILVAGAAIRFLYKVTLKKEWRIEEVVPTCKKPQKLPVVLTPEEVARFLGCIDSNKHRVILTICYATGLRISEAVRLKAASIDSQRMVIRVEQGKGRKDRYVMLSPKLLEVLRGYWRADSQRNGCSQAISPISLSAVLLSHMPAGRRVNSSVSTSLSLLIPCATPSPFISLNPALTSEPSSFCLVIAA